MEMAARLMGALSTSLSGKNYTGQGSPVLVPPLRDRGLGPNAIEDPKLQQLEVIRCTPHGSPLEGRSEGLSSMTATKANFSQRSQLLSDVFLAEMHQNQSKWETSKVN